MQTDLLQPVTYRLLGGPGSPYSLKMRALLRYRRLAHLWIVPSGYLGSQGELRQAGKGMIPVLQFPDGSYHADSTPLIYELERRHPGQRSVLPDDPAAAFLSHLIEDMADELLVAAMFDMRWGSEFDRTFCATRQLSGWLGAMARPELEALVAKFTRRQTSKREAMVTTEGGHQLLASFYLATLTVLESMLEHTDYLFGGRPSLADFGLYAQLCQCALDPSASSIMRARAPRTFQWTQSLDDASGVDGDWAPQPAWEPCVREMLALAGRFYLPLLRAHHHAVETGAESFEVVIDELVWRGQAESYKHKCLVWLQREWAALAPEDKSKVQPMLHKAACLDHLTPVQSTNRPVPDMAPR
jgi:glutathione S-transferase